MKPPHLSEVFIDKPFFKRLTLDSSETIGRKATWYVFDGIAFGFAVMEAALGIAVAIFVIRAALR